MVSEDESPGRPDEKGGRIEASISVLGAKESSREPDLVFDFSETETMSVADLALLVTARQLADLEDRTVWLAGLGSDTWRTLHAMGLSGLFQAFPISDDRRA